MCREILVEISNSYIQTLMTRFKFTASTHTHTLYRFLPQCLFVTSANYSSFFLCIFTGKKFCTVLFRLIYLFKKNFIAAHVQLIYIVLPQCLSVTRAIF